jgi:hypothetical protein
MLEHATFHSISYFNGRTIARTSITPETAQAPECFRGAFALERPVFRMALRRTQQIPERQVTAGYLMCQARPSLPASLCHRDRLRHARWRGNVEQLRNKLQTITLRQVLIVCSAEMILTAMKICVYYKEELMKTNYVCVFGATLHTMSGGWSRSG